MWGEDGEGVGGAQLLMLLACCTPITRMTMIDTMKHSSDTAEITRSCDFSASTARRIFGLFSRRAICLNRLWRAKSASWSGWSASSGIASAKLSFSASEEDFRGCVHGQSSGFVWGGELGRSSGLCEQGRTLGDDEGARILRLLRTGLRAGQFSAPRLSGKKVSSETGHMEPRRASLTASGRESAAKLPTGLLS